MKLRSKILLMCIGCVLTALVLQTCLFQETSSALIYGQAKEESEKSLQNMQNEIHGLLKRMESNLIEIYTEKELIGDLKEQRSIGQLRAEYYRKSYDIAMNEFETGDSVVSLYLYTMDHKIISTYRRAVTPKHNYATDIYNDEENENAGIVKKYVESDDTTMLVSSYYNRYRERNILRLVLKLYNESNLNDKIGYVVCDIDTKNIENIMEKYRTDSTVFMWLQPDGDRVAFTLGSLSSSEQEYYQQMTQKLALGQSVDVKNDLKQEFFQIQQAKYNLTAYSMMPQKVLKQNQRTLTVNLIFIAALMIVVSCLLTFFISRGLTRPLDMLMDTIQQIRDGNTALRTKISNKDEIGELGRNFNEMLDQMESLREKEYQTQKLLSQAEYKALQAQINPHFLYNTLDTMGSIAEIKNCGEVSRLSHSLASIFRYSLNMKNPFSSVSDEISHLKNYIYVMDMRMHDNIKYNFDIQEETFQMKVPRISLQPLVENAINHGLRNKRGDKRITVVVKKTDQTLSICVEDNGVGMQAAEINESLKRNEIDLVEQGNSIGLHNINARLKMLYGQQYGLQLESEVGIGTKVWMILPCIGGEETYA